MSLTLRRRPSRATHTRARLRATLAVAVVAALSASASVAQAAEPGGGTQRLRGELVVALGQDPAEHAHPEHAHSEHAHSEDGHPEDPDAPWGSRLAAVRTPDGRLHPVEADDVRGIAPGSQVDATVTARDGSAPAHVERIAVTGSAATGAIVTDATGTGTDATGIGTQGAITAAATVTHRVFAVLVTPAGTTRDPAVNATSAATLIGRAAAFWSAQSDEVLTFTHAGTTPAYTSAYTCADPWAMWEEAAARTPGFSWGTPGHHLALFLPHAAYVSGGCSYGLGTVGQSAAGATSSGLSYVADFSTAALAHELGHNMSLQHANAFGDAVGEQAGTASAVPYGDRADVMGPGFRDQEPYTHGNLSAVQQARLGLLPAAHRAVVTQLGASTRTLAPVDRTAPASSSAPRLLTVSDPRTGLRYSVEYRAARGFDAHNPFRVVPGVRVLRDSTVQTDETVLVDTTPASGTASDQSLVPGRTWTSISGGVRITVTGATADAATVTVDLRAETVTPVLTVGAAGAAWFTAGGLTASLAPATATGTVAFSTRTGTGTWQPAGTATVVDGIARLAWTPVPTVGQPTVQVRADYTPSSSAAFAPVSGETSTTPAPRTTSTGVRVEGTVAAVTVTPTGPSVPGGPATPAPHGTVTLALEQAGTGDTARRTAALTDGAASVDLADLAPGTWDVRARYPGDTAVLGFTASSPSTSGLTTVEVVAPQPPVPPVPPVAPVVVVAADDATWFTTGELTATVTPGTSAGTPAGTSAGTSAGTVTFSTRTGAGAWQPVGSVPVADGVARLAWTPTPTVGAPTVQVRASFAPAGSDSLAASDDVEVTPRPRSTTTSLLVGGRVGGVAVLTSGAPARGVVDVVLTHTVTGQTLQRPVTLVPGQSSPIDLTDLASGTWTVRATYRGDAAVFGYLASRASTSAPASTTVAGVPDAPTGVTAVAGDRSATVTWTAPADNGSPVTRYTVSSSPAGAWTSVTGATSAVMTGLVNGIDYTFTVRASNAVGTGPASVPSAAVRYTPLTDVAPDDQFAGDIAWLVGRRIAGGYTDGTFRPAAPVSRQAMAAFLHRFWGGEDVPPAASAFRDVPLDATFAREIQWLSARGISTGTPQADGTRLFKPVDPVSRQAMAAFLYRFADSPAFTPPATPTFADVPAGSPFYREVEWLASTGVTTGSTTADGSTVFRPADPVSRQAMAAFLHRLAVHLGRA